MGILGSSEIFQPELMSKNINNDFIDVSTNSLYHGINWIHTYSSDISIYDVNLWYFWDNISLFNEAFNFFFLFCWSSMLKESVDQLFFALLLDNYLYTNLFKYPYYDSWFKNIFTSNENNFFLILHPEFIFLKHFYLTYYNDFFTNLRFVISNNLTSESFFFNINILVQYIFLMSFSVFFIINYFSFFTSPYKEENFIDTDYLTSSSLVEAEKEISSLDDILLTLIILFYIFGWYFYIHCWSLFNALPELTLVFYLFPGLYFIIIGIPTFLILDFGIFFLVYLRGIGGSAILTVEFMYDYLAVIIFYTRILVQGVRLVLMLFTYISMHDLVLFFVFNQKCFLGSEFIWENYNSLSSTLGLFSYYFLFSLVGTFLYWIYEILHTYFVVTIQFAAFFAIVFWLFLFLYTFFVIEKQENYFTEKRLKRKQYFKYLYLKQ